MPPKTKKPRLEQSTSEITESPVSEPSEYTTTQVKPQSGIQHEGDTTPAETSTLEWHNIFQKDFKHEEDTESTSESETDSTTDVKELIVNLEEVKQDEQKDDPEQQDPSEDDDSDEEYTGDCFDGCYWDLEDGSDGSLPGGSSDEDIVFSTSGGTLSRRELRKIEKAAERLANFDCFIGDGLSEHHSDDSEW